MIQMGANARERGASGRKCLPYQAIQRDRTALSVKNANSREGELAFLVAFLAAAPPSPPPFAGICA